MRLACQRHPRLLVLPCAVLGLIAGGASAALRASEPPPTIDWLPAKLAPSAATSTGYVLFQQACSVCHGSGPGKPGTRALRAKYQGKEPPLLEQRRDLNADYVRYTVRHGVSVMPPFRKTELSDAEVDAIAAYLTRKR
jgi:(+)-pinoresinol hydroxylase